MTIDYKKILGQLETCFPSERFELRSLESDIESGKLFFEPDDILPYIQTALLDEKVIEVRFDDNDATHFTKIIDWPPKDTDTSLGEDVPSGKKSFESIDEYFQGMTNITSLPLEPGSGNYNIRQSDRVIMRFFTKSFAVEFCTHFLSTDKNEDTCVLHFGFPTIGRLLKEAREYRAKVIDEFDLKLKITGKRKQQDLIVDVVNVSVNGMAFSLDRDNVNDFLEDEKRKVAVIMDGKELFQLEATVRHLSRIRSRVGISYFCGIQLNLVTQSLTRDVESLMAAVQRAHLQSLSGLAHKTGYTLIA